MKTNTTEIFQEQRYLLFDYDSAIGTILKITEVNRHREPVSAPIIGFVRDVSKIYLTVLYRDAFLGMQWTSAAQHEDFELEPHMCDHGVGKKVIQTDEIFHPVNLKANQDPKATFFLIEQIKLNEEER